jgi:pimeloyl-ACP methyl ester carboxylesterase
MRPEIPIGPTRLPGSLQFPAGPALGLVIFAHGSGSGRRSPRNRYVADELNRRGFATLLFDLLTEDESFDRANVFDIPLLARRLGEAIDWQRTHQPVAALPTGLFGASTGAAAALVAAARTPEDIGALVSRGGRPDMAGAMLDQVRAPTLLIVGGQDLGVLELNEQALAQLRCEKSLEIVPGATHLFEERGALDQVIDLAQQWFTRHLAGRSGEG